jgi:acyl-CoA synthetase (AMP-forming)/AMP-acid ligase II
MMGERRDTVVSILRERSEKLPDRVGYTYLNDRSDGGRDITYGELDARARALAVELQAHCRPGDRALLIGTSGPDFLFGFFGCLYAGVIAVPSPEPVLPREADRLAGIVASARPAVALGPSRMLASDAVVALGRPAIVPEGVHPDLAVGWTTSSPQPSDVAFLQYTSGSTGAPRGVMVTHGNIVANEEMVRSRFEHDASSTFVGWLPCSHDMGLIGNVLQPFYVGSRSVLMSPSAFIRDPLRWLRAISTYRARTSGGPNFAYDLCVRRYEKEGKPLDVDLSSWDIAFVGAEPVRASSIERFAEMFAQYGFRRSALYPCYGLAEATLFATGGSKGAGPRYTERRAALPAELQSGPRGALVGCGRAADGLDVRIVERRTGRECADGEEGEILLAGGSVCAGYWGQEAETRDTFGGTVPGSDARYLRTGDVGVHVDGEIFVTGRIRDLIIVRGQNLYPQDIEAAAEAAGGLQAGSTVAFGFELEGEERVVLVAEAKATSGGADAMCARVREAVADAQDIHVDVIVLIQPRTLAKTTSGKVERQATKRAFLEGGLHVLAASSTLRECKEVWCTALAPSQSQATISV